MIDEYDSKGMRASGKFANELEVVASSTNVILLGGEHSEQLEYGRGKTKTGGTKGSGKLIDQIKQWIKDKGIVSNIKNDNDNSTLAFLITRKIHREGWNRSRRGGVGLISKVITESRIQSIINKVGVSQVDTLVLVLQKEFNNIK